MQVNVAFSNDVAFSSAQSYNFSEFSNFAFGLRVGFCISDCLFYVFRIIEGSIL